MKLNIIVFDNNNEVIINTDEHALGFKAYVENTCFTIFYTDCKELFEIPTEVLREGIKPYLPRTLTVLSTPLILGDGMYTCRTLSCTTEAVQLVKDFQEFGRVEIFTQHDTVKLLGLEPSKERSDCLEYHTALVGKPLQRLEFGKEYSIEEIEQIGVEWKLINFYV